MHELTLFPPATRTTDPETSRNAEDRMKGGRSTKNHTVLALLRAHPEGMTSQEVEDALRYRDVTTGKMVTNWWRRLSDLKHLGLVRVTGEVRDGCEVHVVA